LACKADEGPAIADAVVEIRWEVLPRAFVVAAIAFAALSNELPAIARPVAAVESAGFAAASVVAADFVAVAVVVAVVADADAGVRSSGVGKKPYHYQD
jgi:hypothetical protein